MNKKPYNVQPGYKRVNFDISERLHAKLKVHCAKLGMTMKDFVNSLIENLPDLVPNPDHDDYIEDDRDDR